MASTKDKLSEPDRLWSNDDERNRALYRRLLREHGSSARALNWGDQESQTLRFSVLAEIGIGATSSILDVGFGPAALRGLEPSMFDYEPPLDSDIASR